MWYLAAGAIGIAAAAATVPLACGAQAGQGPREHVAFGEGSSFPASSLSPSRSGWRSAEATHLRTGPGTARETTQGKLREGK